MGDMVRHRGVVEEPALQLGVVWIREQGTGMRILIDLNEAGTERSTTIVTSMLTIR